jgi:hypothetical protein
MRQLWSDYQKKPEFRELQYLIGPDKRSWEMTDDERLVEQLYRDHVVPAAESMQRTLRSERGTAGQRPPDALFEWIASDTPAADAQRRSEQNYRRAIALLQRLEAGDVDRQALIEADIKSLILGFRRVPPVLAPWLDRKKQDNRAWKFGKPNGEEIEALRNAIITAYRRAQAGYADAAGDQTLFRQDPTIFPPWSRALMVADRPSRYVPTAEGMEAARVYDRLKRVGVDLNVAIATLGGPSVFAYSRFERPEHTQLQRKLTREHLRNPRALPPEEQRLFDWVVWASELDAEGLWGEHQAGKRLTPEERQAHIERQYRGAEVLTPERATRFRAEAQAFEGEVKGHANRVLYDALLDRMEEKELTPVPLRLRKELLKLSPNDLRLFWVLLPTLTKEEAARFVERRSTTELLAALARNFERVDEAELGFVLSRELRGVLEEKLANDLGGAPRLASEARDRLRSALASALGQAAAGSRTETMLLAALALAEESAMVFRRPDVLIGEDLRRTIGAWNEQPSNADLALLDRERALLRTERFDRVKRLASIAAEKQFVEKNDVIFAALMAMRAQHFEQSRVNVPVQTLLAQRNDRDLIESFATLRRYDRDVFKDHLGRLFLRSEPEHWTQLIRAYGDWKVVTKGLDQAAVTALAGESLERIDRDIHTLNEFTLRYGDFFEDRSGYRPEEFLRIRGLKFDEGGKAELFAQAKRMLRGVRVPELVGRAPFEELRLPGTTGPIVKDPNDRLVGLSNDAEHRARALRDARARGLEPQGETRAYMLDRLRELDELLEGGTAAAIYSHAQGNVGGPRQRFVDSLRLERREAERFVCREKLDEHDFLLAERLRNDGKLDPEVIGRLAGFAPSDWLGEGVDVDAKLRSLGALDLAQLEVSLKEHRASLAGNAAAARRVDAVLAKIPAAIEAKAKPYKTVRRRSKVKAGGKTLDLGELCRPESFWWGQWKITLVKKRTLFGYTVIHGNETVHSKRLGRDIPTCPHYTANLACQNGGADARGTVPFECDPSVPPQQHCRGKCGLGTVPPGFKAHWTDAFTPEDEDWEDAKKSIVRALDCWDMVDIVHNLDLETVRGIARSLLTDEMKDIYDHSSARTVKNHPVAGAIRRSVEPEVRTKSPNNTDYSNGLQGKNAENECKRQFVDAVFDRLRMPPHWMKTRYHLNQNFGTNAYQKDRNRHFLFNMMQSEIDQMDRFNYDTLCAAHAQPLYGKIPKAMVDDATDINKTFEGIRGVMGEIRRKRAEMDDLLARGAPQAARFVQSGREVKPVKPADITRDFLTELLSLNAEGNDASLRIKLGEGVYYIDGPGRPALPRGAVPSTHWELEQHRDELVQHYCKIGKGGPGNETPFDAAIAAGLARIRPPVRPLGNENDGRRLLLKAGIASIVRSLDRDIFYSSRAPWRDSVRATRRGDQLFNLPSLSSYLAMLESFCASGGVVGAEIRGLRGTMEEVTGDAWKKTPDGAAAEELLFRYGFAAASGMGGGAGAQTPGLPLRTRAALRTLPPAARTAVAALIAAAKEDGALDSIALARLLANPTPLSSFELLLKNEKARAHFVDLLTRGDAKAKALLDEKVGAKSLREHLLGGLGLNEARALLPVLREKFMALARKEGDLFTFTDEPLAEKLAGLLTLVDELGHGGEYDDLPGGNERYSPAGVHRTQSRLSELEAEARSGQRSAQAALLAEVEAYFKRLGRRLPAVSRAAFLALSDDSVRKFRSVRDILLASRSNAHESKPGEQRFRRLALAPSPAHIDSTLRQIAPDLYESLVVHGLTTPEAGGDPELMQAAVVHRINRLRRALEDGFLAGTKLDDVADPDHANRKAVEELALLEARLATDAALPPIAAEFAQVDPLQADIALDILRLAVAKDQKARQIELARQRTAEMEARDPRDERKRPAEDREREERARWERDSAEFVLADRARVAHLLNNPAELSKAVDAYLKVEEQLDARRRAEATQRGERLPPRVPLTQEQKNAMRDLAYRMLLANASSPEGEFGADPAVRDIANRKLHDLARARERERDMLREQIVAERRQSLLGHHGSPGEIQKRVRPRLADAAMAGAGRAGTPLWPTDPSFDVFRRALPHREVDDYQGFLGFRPADAKGMPTSGQCFTCLECLHKTSATDLGERYAACERWGRCPAVTDDLVKLWWKPPPPFEDKAVANDVLRRRSAALLLAARCEERSNTVRALQNASKKNDFEQLLSEIGFPGPGTGPKEKIDGEGFRRFLELWLRQRGIHDLATLDPFARAMLAMDLHVDLEIEFRRAYGEGVDTVDASTGLRRRVALSEVLTRGERLFATDVDDARRALLDDLDNGVVRTSDAGVVGLGVAPDASHVERVRYLRGLPATLTAPDETAIRERQLFVHSEMNKVKRELDRKLAELTRRNPNSGEYDAPPEVIRDHIGNLERRHAEILAESQQLELQRRQRLQVRQMAIAGAILRERLKVLRKQKVEKLRPSLERTVTQLANLRGETVDPKKLTAEELLDRANTWLSQAEVEGLVKKLLDRKPALERQARDELAKSGDGILSDVVDGWANTRAHPNLVAEWDTVQKLLDGAEKELRTLDPKFMGLTDLKDLERLGERGKQLIERYNRALGAVRTQWIVDRVDALAGIPLSDEGRSIRAELAKQRRDLATITDEVVGLERAIATLDPVALRGKPGANELTAFQTMASLPLGDEERGVVLKAASLQLLKAARETAVGPDGKPFATLADARERFWKPNGWENEVSPEVLRAYATMVAESQRALDGELHRSALGNVLRARGVQTEGALSVAPDVFERVIDRANVMYRQQRAALSLVDETYTPLTDRADRRFELSDHVDAELLRQFREGQLNAIDSHDGVPLDEGQARRVVAQLRAAADRRPDGSAGRTAAEADQLGAAVRSLAEIGIRFDGAAVNFDLAELDRLNVLPKWDPRNPRGYHGSPTIRWAKELTSQPDRFNYDPAKARAYRSQLDVLGRITGHDALGTLMDRRAVQQLDALVSRGALSYAGYVDDHDGVPRLVAGRSSEKFSFHLGNGQAPKYGVAVEVVEEDGRLVERAVFIPLAHVQTGLIRARGAVRNQARDAKRIQEGRPVEDLEYLGSILDYGEGFADNFDPFWLGSTYRSYDPNYQTTTARKVEADYNAAMASMARLREAGLIEVEGETGIGVARGHLAAASLMARYQGMIAQANLDQAKKIEEFVMYDLPLIILSRAIPPARIARLAKAAHTAGRVRTAWMLIQAAKTLRHIRHAEVAAAKMTVIMHGGSQLVENYYLRPQEAEKHGETAPWKFGRFDEWIPAYEHTALWIGLQGPVAGVLQRAGVPKPFAAFIGSGASSVGATLALSYRWNTANSENYDKAFRYLWAKITGGDHGLSFEERKRATKTLIRLGTEFFMAGIWGTNPASGIARGAAEWKVFRDSAPLRALAGFGGTFALFNGLTAISNVIEQGNEFGWDKVKWSEVQKALIASAPAHVWFSLAHGREALAHRPGAFDFARAAVKGVELDRTPERQRMTEYWQEVRAAAKSAGRELPEEVPREMTNAEVLRRVLDTRYENDPRIRTIVDAMVVEMGRASGRPVDRTVALDLVARAAVGERIADPRVSAFADHAAAYLEYRRMIQGLGMPGSGVEVGTAPPLWRRALGALGIGRQPGAEGAEGRSYGRADVLDSLGLQPKDFVRNPHRHALLDALVDEGVISQDTAQRWRSLVFSEMAPRFDVPAAEVRPDVGRALAFGQKPLRALPAPGSEAGAPRSSTAGPAPRAPGPVIDVTPRKPLMERVGDWWARYRARNEFLGEHSQTLQGYRDSVLLNRDLRRGMRDETDFVHPWEVSHVDMLRVRPGDLLPEIQRPLSGAQVPAVRGTSSGLVPATRADRVPPPGERPLDRRVFEREWLRLLEETAIRNGADPVQVLRRFEELRERQRGTDPSMAHTLRNPELTKSVGDILVEVRAAEAKVIDAELAAAGVRASSPLARPLKDVAASLGWKTRVEITVEAVQGRLAAERYRAAQEASLLPENRQKPPPVTDVKALVRIMKAEAEAARDSAQGPFQWFRSWFRGRGTRGGNALAPLPGESP